MSVFYQSRAIAQLTPINVNGALIYALSAQTSTFHKTVNFFNQMHRYSVFVYFTVTVTFSTMPVSYSLFPLDMDI